VDSADFVVLFIPGESFLYAAAQVQPDLLERAMARNVVIATPTTLVSLLKVVALGWREERLAESAREIARVGRELHGQIAVALEHTAKLGRGLTGVVNDFNAMQQSIERRVLPKASALEQLGAKSQRDLPSLPRIDAACHGGAAEL
jgi:DNA recombination protein RmuC